MLSKAVDCLLSGYVDPSFDAWFYYHMSPIVERIVSCLYLYSYFVFVICIFPMVEKKRSVRYLPVDFNLWLYLHISCVYWIMWDEPISYGCSCHYVCGFLERAQNLMTRKIFKICYAIPLFTRAKTIKHLRPAKLVEFI